MDLGKRGTARLVLAAVACDVGVATSITTLDKVKLPNSNCWTSFRLVSTGPGASFPVAGAGWGVGG